MSLKKLTLMIVVLMVTGAALYALEHRASLPDSTESLSQSRILQDFSPQSAVEISIAKDDHAFTLERAKLPRKGEWGLREAPDADLDAEKVSAILTTLSELRSYNPFQPDLSASQRTTERSAIPAAFTEVKSSSSAIESFGFDRPALRVELVWDVGRNGKHTEKNETLLFGKQNTFSGRRYVYFQNRKLGALVDEFVFGALNLDSSAVRESLPFRFHPPALLRAEIESSNHAPYSLERDKGITRWIVREGNQSFRGDNETIEKKLLALSLLRPARILDRPQNELSEQFSTPTASVTLFFRDNSSVVRKILFLEREEQIGSETQRQYFAKFSDRPAIYVLANRFALEFLQPARHFALRKPLLELNPDQVAGICSSTVAFIPEGLKNPCPEKSAKIQFLSATEFQALTGEIRELEFLSVVDAFPKGVESSNEQRGKEPSIHLVIALRNGDANRHVDVYAPVAEQGAGRSSPVAEDLTSTPEGDSSSAKVAGRPSPRWTSISGMNGQKMLGVVSGEQLRGLQELLQNSAHQSPERETTGLEVPS